MDLEDLFQTCKAALAQSIGLKDAEDFASDLLLTAAKKGHKFSQYYVGRCYDTGKHYLTILPPLVSHPFA